jgi:hypothetical protein
VLRTRDVEHTRDVITWLLKRVNEDKIPTFVASLNVANEAGNQKFKMKDFSGPPWATMLTAIHGVSKAKAKEISKLHGSAKALIKHMESIGGKLGIKRISKVLEKSIADTIFG